MNDKERNRLEENLVKLGDMMGDGLHLEPNGKWIEKEYRRILKALGLLPRKDTSHIDKFMENRVKQVKCKCGGRLKQTRKGSYIGKCIDCGSKYRLGTTKKRK